MVDRKSTRLNSSHDQISYAVFCLKKKTSARDSTPPRTAKLPIACRRGSSRKRGRFGALFLRRHGIKLRVFEDPHGLRNSPVDAAIAYVFCYTVRRDMTRRDLQQWDNDHCWLWDFGNNFD